jgi:hypothetical protein
VKCVAFAPDRRHLAFNADGVARLCETATLKEVRRFGGE